MQTGWTIGAWLVVFVVPLVLNIVAIVYYLRGGEREK